MANCLSSSPMNCRNLKVGRTLENYRLLLRCTVVIEVTYQNNKQWGPFWLCQTFRRCFGPGFKGLLDPDPGA